MVQLGCFCLVCVCVHAYVHMCGVRVFVCVSASRAGSKFENVKRLCEGLDMVLRFRIGELESVKIEM